MHDLLTQELRLYVLLSQVPNKNYNYSIGTPTNKASLTHWREYRNLRSEYVRRIG